MNRRSFIAGSAGVLGLAATPALASTDFKAIVSLIVSKNFTCEDEAIYFVTGIFELQLGRPLDEVYKQLIESTLHFYFNSSTKYVICLACFSDGTIAWFYETSVEEAKEHAKVLFPGLVPLF